MMIETLRFGPLEVDEDQVLLFEQGLPGFEKLRRFLLVAPDGDLPFAFLQSVEDGEVALLLTNPFMFYADYEFELPEDAVQSLRIDSQDDVAIWSVVSLTGSLETATLNLLAPIVLHMKERVGRQVILHGSGYQTKHPLRQPLLPEPQSAAAKEEGDHARTDT